MTDDRPCLREMLRVRRFEEKAAELYTLGKIRGFLHLCIGEEAVSVGAVRALAPEDNVVSTYREHGHALARGIPMAALMAELFGKATGCCRGRGGSMHFFDVTRRFYGGNAIVGGGLPLAVGLALADHLQARQAVTMCLFGDGAVAEGEFHESMNLAALWRLPVLFVCENNLYAMGTALTRHQAQPDIARKADGYGVVAESVDGMDVTAVARTIAAHVDAIRDGVGPRLVEARTYRFRAHSMYDPELYRSKAEVEQWKLRDPIPALVEQLRRAGLLDDGALAALEAEVDAEIAAAVAAAEAAPWEPARDLLRDVHTPTDADAGEEAKSCA
jgi:pyruvate dehydrogenase E1 component alpha subunit